MWKLIWGFFFFGLAVAYMLLLENEVDISFHYTEYSKPNFGKIQFTGIEVYHLVQFALTILRNCTFSYFILARGSDWIICFDGKVCKKKFLYREERNCHKFHYIYAAHKWKYLVQYIAPSPKCNKISQFG